MTNKGNDFEDVQDAFRKGDPRPLAQWVLHHDLTQSQREYVALALCGDIAKIDGRKVKPTTERMLSDYSQFQWINHTIASFDLDEMGMEFLKDADIVRKLAKKYGYQDSDSVRRAISRHKRKMKDIVPMKKKILEKLDTKKNSVLNKILAGTVDFLPCNPVQSGNGAFIGRKRHGCHS